MTDGEWARGSLDELRDTLDGIDRQIVRVTSPLLADRAAVVKRVAYLKRSLGMDTLQSGREGDVIAHWRETSVQCEGDPDEAELIARAVMTRSRERQNQPQHPPSAVS